jgi:phosphoglycerate dehydrogenase-like enzyme
VPAGAGCRGIRWWLTGRAAIAGAAIDVWYQYPTDGDRGEPSQLPFSSLENVLMTPHLSGLTTATFRGRVADIVRNLHALADSTDLINVVSR